MAHIKQDVHIANPPEEVFAVLVEVERLPRFSDMTVGVRHTPGRPLRPGDRFTQIIRLAGMELETDWEVTELEPNVLLRVEGRSQGGGRATLVERISPEGGGSRVAFEVDYDMPLGVLGDIADKLVGIEQHHEEDAERILSRLKELCETGRRP